MPTLTGLHLEEAGCTAVEVAERLPWFMTGCSGEQRAGGGHSLPAIFIGLFKAVNLECLTQLARKCRVYTLGFESGLGEPPSCRAKELWLARFHSLKTLELRVACVHEPSQLEVCKQPPRG